MTDTLSDPVLVVGELYARFGRGDVEGLIALLAVDVEWRSPGPKAIPYAGSWRGTTEVRAWFGRFLGAVEMREFSVDRLVASGDTVVALGRERAAVRATGREFATDFAHVWTVANGRVTAFRDILDTAAQVAAFA